MLKFQAKIYVLLLLIFSATNYSFGQIELSKESTEKEKKVDKKNNVKMDGATSIYLTSNWSRTSRLLKMNDGYFGDSLGERANEKPLDKWSFGLGFSNRFHANFIWQGGIAFLRNGEKYNHSEADSSYAYETTYTYIGMPIKILFTYGDKIQLQAGIGVVPQMVAGYKKTIKWSTTEGGALSETQKINTDKANTFVMSTVFNLGIQVTLSNRLGVLIMPEYKLQLSSSFGKNSGYKHFGRSLGCNLGFVFQL